MPQDLFADLKTDLEEFDDFLGTNTAKLKPAYDGLVLVVPELPDLIDDLIALLDQVNAKVQAFQLPAVGQENLTTFSNFSGAAKGILESAKLFSEGDEEAIQEIQAVIDAINLVGGVASLDTTVKAAIDAAITSIKGHLTTLKS